MTKAAKIRQNAVAVNEALLIAGLRQHELTEVAERLNARLQVEIVERELAEAALRKAIDDLKQAQSATERASGAKDAFLAALSHELRTPLTPVLMTAADLRKDERLPLDVREQLGMIERNIEIEARLIDDLLDITKISQGKLQFRPEPCDAHLLIDFAIEIVREDARAAEISIERIFTAQHSGLVVDPARFQQIIWNLLRNAVKFTPRGGKISVLTRDENLLGGTWLRIEVEDWGIGIDPSRLDQIFMPFDQGGLTGDHRFGGVGLGLAIARTVVDLHGGRISAESAGLGSGARFVVELPGAVETGSVKTPISQPVLFGSFAAGLAAPKVASLRLLVVEDHESTLQTLCRLLQRDGHRVVTAATVAQAVTAAANGVFDLVISDLGLPDGTGGELMEKLRARYGLRGIALTGYGTAKDILCSRASGFVAHLVKPICITELRQALAELAKTINSKQE